MITFEEAACLVCSYLDTQLVKGKDNTNSIIINTTPLDAFSSSLGCKQW